VIIDLSSLVVRRAWPPCNLHAPQIGGGYLVWIYCEYIL